MNETLDTNDAGDTAPFGQTLSFKNLFTWAVALVRSPRTFYRNMAKDGGYLTPILYALAWQFMAGAVWVLASFVRPAAMPFGLGGKIVWLLLGPGIILLLGFVVSAVLFVIWHLMGSTRGYQTAFRVWAYMMPLAVVSALLSLIPYVSILVLVWRFFLTVEASIETHGIRARLAWTVWGILLALFLVIQIAAVAFVLLRRQMSAGVFPGQTSSIPGMLSSGSGAPSAANSKEFQKKVIEEMAKHRAEFEKLQKNKVSPPPTEKK